jgi:hypothetical protein
MKLRPDNSNAPRQSGILLTECLVYLAVFTILLGLGMAAFYFCWDHTRSVISAANNVESALRAGERWRADVRAATGTISVETTAAGEIVKIPESGNEIVYRFENGGLRREISSPENSQLLLEKVNASEMKIEPRDGVTAWRWELELTPQRRESHFPLLCTFEAVQMRP